MTISAYDQRLDRHFERRPKVFILQEPMKHDQATGRMVSAMNFAKASEYGDTVVCVPPGQVALSPQPLITRLKDCLRDYRDGDYVIAVGDPTVMFVAAMVLCELNRGQCQMLKWDKITRNYIAVQINLHRKVAVVE